MHSDDADSVHRTLYKVQWKVVHSLYGQNLGCDQPLGEMETVAEVFKLEQELSEWEHTLVGPLCLRIPSSVLLDQESALDERFRVILTLRYLNLQILLHRPVLSRCLELRGNSSDKSHTLRSAEQMIANSIETCVLSSENIIAIVHSIVSAKPSVELLGAWWFSLYYCKRTSRIISGVATDYFEVFSAALVIFASSLIPPGQAAQPSVAQVEQRCAFLGQATDAIRHLDGETQVSRRCIDHLEKLSLLLLRRRKSCPT